MRRVTREVAFREGTWTRERAQKVASLFDELAPTWSDRDVAERHDALRDALARGGPFPTGPCLEVGAGTGSATVDLSGVFDVVVSMDLSREMLARGAGTVPRVLADGSRLPVAPRSVAVVALINMLLFPLEVARAVASDGAVLWVNTNGDATPIYLSAGDVLDALPGEWDGVASSAGWGTWLVARRRAAHLPGAAGIGATRAL
ncbi:MAG: class I SAM-dependent methyltransferase [Acidimicrobiales bacterium]